MCVYAQGLESRRGTGQLFGLYFRPVVTHCVFLNIYAVDAVVIMLGVNKGIEPCSNF